MRLPQPRGAISSELFDILRRDPDATSVDDDFVSLNESTESLNADDDLQISLFTLYGLHYHGFEKVDSRWEWNPSLIRIRGHLESRWEDELTRCDNSDERVDAADIPQYLLKLAPPATGPGLSGYMKHKATIEQFRELVIHRSIYNLVEGDQHTWAIPRLAGRAKGALVEIQSDEYGQGMPGRMHLELFQLTMEELDLDPTYGAYVNRIPAVALSILNVMSFFGLHLRWRGALLGNLAVTEIGSSIANRRYSEGLSRLGASSKARWFYEEHVMADPAHEQIAAHDMCGSFVRDYTMEAGSVLTGARSTLALRGAFAIHVTKAWDAGISSLREGS